MAEWPIAPVLKTGDVFNVSWVQIPLPPFLEILFLYEKNRKFFTSIGVLLLYEVWKL